MDPPWFPLGAEDKRFKGPFRGLITRFLSADRQFRQAFRVPVRGLLFNRVLELPLGSYAVVGEKCHSEFEAVYKTLGVRALRRSL